MWNKYGVCMVFALLMSLKMLQYVADLINQIADMGSFNSKSESARSSSAKHVMDANLLDSRRMWDEIKSHPTRQLSAERLIKDICSIKDEM